MTNGRDHHESHLKNTQTFSKPVMATNCIIANYSVNLVRKMLENSVI